jgi:signal transduction histidine kinase
MISRNGDTGTKVASIHQRHMRRRLFAFLGFGVIAGPIFVAVGLWATSAFVDNAVERDASRRSVEWSTYAAETIPRIDTIVAGAKPDAEQMLTLERMEKFGGVFRFKIFSPDGNLHFVSDDPNAAGRTLGAHNPTAASVIEDGRAYTVVADGTNKPNRPDLYSETYLPIWGPDGRVVAIAETYLDQTETTKAVRTEYLTYGLVMVSLVCLALLIPSMALFSMFRKLQARNLELDAERIRAQQADMAKTQFLATISHELRTPMNGVIGAAQLLELVDLPEEDKELIDILNSCADSQMALIEEILTFGEIEAGALRIKAEPMEVNAFMRNATSFATILAQKKDLSFNLEVPEGAPVVLGDAKRLRQVIVNLVGNAVKFTEEGSVSVKATVERIDGSDEGVFRVAVTDTGMGIAPEHQAQIFERFMQGDSSSSRKAGGTGLGLSIALGIAHESGGDISLESELGKGSTFTFEMKTKIVNANDGTSPTERNVA